MNVEHEMKISGALHTRLRAVKNFWFCNYTRSSGDPGRKQLAAAYATRFLIVHAFTVRNRPNACSGQYGKRKSSENVVSLCLPN